MFVCHSKFSFDWAEFIHLQCISYIFLLTNFIHDVALCTCCGVFIQYYKEEYTELDQFFMSEVLNYVNIVFTSVFTIECILKIIAFNPKVCYWSWSLQLCRLQTIDTFRLISCFQISRSFWRNLFLDYGGFLDWPHISLVIGLANAMTVT